MLSSTPPDVVAPTAARRVPRPGMWGEIGSVDGERRRETPYGLAVAGWSWLGTDWCIRLICDDTTDQESYDRMVHCAMLLMLTTALPDDFTRYASYASYT